jgi:ABC-type phosphate transport system substrate-binding protein
MLSNAGNAFAEVVVIVSAKSKISSLSISQTARIFLGKSSSFPDGSTAIPLDQAEGSQIRNEFYAKVTGKDPAQINAYWSKIIFTGEGQPPRQLQGNDSIRKAVARNPKAIGYIDKSAVTRKVKIILIP